MSPDCHVNVTAHPQIFACHLRGDGGGKVSALTFSSVRKCGYVKTKLLRDHTRSTEPLSRSLRAITTKAFIVVT